MAEAGLKVRKPRWRHGRPFWGGLFVLLGGAEIMATVWAPLGVVLHVGMQNFIGYLIPIVIILCGLLLWFNPAQRLFYSLVAMVCALASFITSNMGGFIVGLLLTLTGGALAFAWTTDDRVAEEQPVEEQPAEDPTITDLSIITGSRRAEDPTEE